MSFTLPTVEIQTRNTATGVRVTQVRKRIQQVTEKMGKDPSTVCLIAASRSLMTDPVVEAAEAGIKDFCEDFLPEGITKQPVVDHRVSGLTWHFTGSLLNKKLHLAVEFFDWIHTLDRLTLLRSLTEAVKSKTKKLHVLIEVNVLGHQKRMGIDPKELPALAKELALIPNLVLSGLSFKSEHFLSSENSLVAYKEMAKLHKKLLDNGVLSSHATELAMGCSQDYERAIEEGATMLRLGQAVFGTHTENSFIKEEEWNP